MPRCQATEQHTLREALDRLPGTEAGSRTILRRLDLLSPFPKDATILDVGAAHGRFLVACAKMGYEAVGLEPWPQAIEVAVALANHEDVSIRIVCGVAEALPFASEQFWLVHAMSVIEHVEDASQAFREAYRVLKPGGHFGISDVVLKGELPLGITAAADFYAACISGAVQKEEYLQMLSRAGFTDIRVTQEKPLQLSDADILCYASREDLADFRARGTSVLSITVRGEKPQVLA